MAKVFNYATQDEWLALRAADVTSTAIAALYGVSPYETPYQIYQRLANGVVVAVEETERMQAGNYLEAAIAQWAGDKLGAKVRPRKVYMRHDGIDRFGSSFDFEIYDYDPAFVQAALGLPAPPSGPGNLEIKNVDARFEERWLTGERDADGAKVYEAPHHIELQFQAQLAVSGDAWGAIAVLFGGNHHVMFGRVRDDEMVADIEQVVRDFLARVDARDEPAPDLRADGEVIRALRAQATPAKEYDGDQRDRIEALVRERDALNAQIRDLQAAAEERRNEILLLIEDAESVPFPDGSRLSAKTIVKAPYTVTPKPSRDLRFIKPKAKAEKADA